MCPSAAAELAGLARQLDTDDCGADSRWLGDCEEGRGWHRLLREQTASLRGLLERHADQLTPFRGACQGTQTYLNTIRPDEEKFTDPTRCE